MGNKPTIQMVADLAGVSRGTVDRVLNGRAHVREDVRARVLDAIQETGYISPRAAYQQQTLAPIRLGVLLPNWDNQFSVEVAQGIRQAQEELSGANVQVLTRKCKTDLPQEAIALLGELRECGASGLAVCALNDPSVERCVSKCVESGIPCITFNSDLPGSRRVCFVGQDVRHAARVAAGLMSKCVTTADAVLVAVGNLKFDGHCQRLNGFRERMLEYGFQPEQMLVRETFNDYETTFRLVTEALAAHPGLRGIYMANHSVSACAAAIAAAGKKGSVHVICHDINDSIRQLLLDGSIDFTIPQNFVQQGYAPLMLLRDLLRRGTLANAGRLNGQIDILCVENLPDNR